MNGSILVSRNSPRDIKVRGLEVYIDDIFAANLQFGRAVKVDVAPGEHEVRVTNTLYSAKISLSVADGEARELRAGNTLTGLFAPMFLAVGIGPYRVFLEEVEAPDVG